MERKAAYRSHVRGSASDPAEGGGSKDSLQDHETENDTNISNDETTGHERDELKEADLETENIWVRFWRKLRAYSHSLMKIWRNLTRYRPRRSHDIPEVYLSQLADEDEDDQDYYACNGDDYGSDDGSGVEGSSWEPNPGIKRPTVTVLKPPPPTL